MYFTYFEFDYESVIIPKNVLLKVLNKKNWFSAWSFKSSFALFENSALFLPAWFLEVKWKFLIPWCHNYPCYGSLALLTTLTQTLKVG